MKLSNEFENLVTKQLESFGCISGVEHLVVYIVSAREGSKAGFELFSQWPEVNKFLLPVDDDPEVKVASPRRRWYPLQNQDILIGVLRVETNFNDSEWPLLLDSRLKALSISLAKIFAIEIERQKNADEISFLRNQVGVIIHQLRNPLAALRTYAKLLIKRLGPDDDSIEIIESMLVEQNQINQYIDSFEQLNTFIKMPLEMGEERLLLPPNLENEKKITLQNLLIPILERGKANANLESRKWTEPSFWPDWTLTPIESKYGVIAEIVANLLENAFKYAKEDAEIGIAFTSRGLCIFDEGEKITKSEIEKIFQKGFRGSASKEKDGTGVGLFLARKLAKQIGGDLKLLEKPLNNEVQGIKVLKKKNIFYLELPIEKLHR